MFSELGLNLHATDIQAALGLVQLSRLDGFIAARRSNWAKLKGLTDGLPFTVPAVADGCSPSWFTFPMLVREGRDALMAHLAENGIESRPVVAGNMTRQPVSPGDPAAFPVADEWFRNGLWVSVHPQLTDADLQHIAAALRAFWSARG